jgi:hypothetical protein
VEPTRLQKERKAKEQLAEKHINRSWEKELEGVEFYCQRQEKVEGTRRQPMFLMEQWTLYITRIQVTYRLENRVLFHAYKSVVWVYYASTHNVSMHRLTEEKQGTQAASCRQHTGEITATLTHTTTK